MASPGKTTQHHRNPSTKIPARALGSKTCSKLAALLQLLISDSFGSTNKITFQLGQICVSLENCMEESFVSSRAIAALSVFVAEVHISDVISYFNKLQ